MSTIDDGGSAFPSPDRRFGSGLIEGADGMTLRDWFAGQALAGFLGNSSTATIKAETLALATYDMADAMLKARKVSSE